MALNIGNLNFGVDANTAGLQKAIAQLSAFQRKTDQVAQAQAKGSQQLAAAMGRQETAIKRAFQQTLNLQRQMRESGAPAEQIARVSNAFRRLTTEMTSGKLSAVEYNRAMDSFTAKMGRAKRGLGDFNKTTKEGQTGIKKYAVLLRDLESSAVLALGPLSGLGARVRSLGAIFGRSSIRVALIVTAIAGAVIAIGTLGAAAVRAGSALKSIELRLEAATGSAALTGKHFKFITALSQQLGLEVGELAKSYSRFIAATQGTSIEGAKSRKIFEQITRAAAALKLETTDVTGVMRALEQIMSKGTVQAEELRGQLGDRLPGAFRIAAKSMGVTTRELNRMLKAGEVISDEFLPKFAAAYEEAIGKNAEKNTKTLTGAMNVLKTNTQLWLQDVDRITHASSATTAVVNGLAGAMAFLAGETDGSALKTRAVSRALEEAEAAAAKNVKVVRILGAAYTTMSKVVDGLDDDLRPLEEAIGFFGRVPGDIDFLVDFFTRLGVSAGASKDELDEMAEKLSMLTGRDIEASAEGIASGFAAMQERARAANDQVERLRNAPSVLKAVTEELQEMRDRFKAFSQGAGEGELFDKVEMGVRKYQETLKGTLLTEQERIVAAHEFRGLLIAQIALEDSHTEAKKRAADASREAAQQQKRLNKGITDAVLKIGELQGKVKALVSGPDSLEYFDQVEQPFIEFAQGLRELTDNQDILNALTGRYRELLEENLKLTDRFARASDQLANATLNMFEDMIVKGESLKDVLHGLGTELLRLLLRTFVFDKLQSGISGFFNKSIFGGGQGAGVTAANTSSGGFASGGSFKLGGSGGSDKVPFGGFGKPGETVTVARPDQGGGGSTPSIYINAPGADAGTIERIREMIRSEMVPQIIQAASANTITKLRRPRFA